jgi:hypothetical protein
MPSVQLITPDDGHRRCPKHVEFRDNINFGYLMHLVCYLYKAYHDAWSLEHKVGKYVMSINISIQTSVSESTERHNEAVNIIYGPK